MVAIRHRLRKVSVDVKEEDRLCNKTSTAIEYLLRYKHFSEILQALENLGKDCFLYEVRNVYKGYLHRI